MYLQKFRVTFAALFLPGQDKSATQKMRYLFMSALLKTAKAHRALTLLLILEVLFLAGLSTVSLIRPQTVVTISWQDIQPTYDFPVTASVEQGIQVYSPEPVDHETVFSQKVPLPSGAYDVNVQYQSVSNPKDPSYNMYDFAGHISFRLDSNPQALQSESINLSDSDTSTTGRIWLRLGAGADDLTMDVEYYGQGLLAIQQIEFRECMSYRAARILGFLALFAVVDFLLVLLFFPKLCPFSRVTRFAVLGVILIAFLSSLTFFMDYLMRHGNDLEFHLNRIVSLAQALKDGQFPQRLETGMLNGYGYTSPLFYGEIFFLLPAVLLLLSVPVQTAYQIYGVTVNFVTAFLAFWVFHKIVGDWKKALMGTALYTLSVCRLVCLTVRGAVGEYTAMVFFPLIIYGFYKIYTDPDSKKRTLADCAPIIIGLSGILQSHMLSCEIAAIFILLLVVIFWKKTFAPQRFIGLAKSAALTFFLNAWFLIPFIDSMTSMSLKINDPQALNNVEFQAAYPVQLFTFSPTSFGTTYDTAYQEMPMNLGPGLLFALGLFVFYCVWASEQKNNKKEFVPLITLFGFGGLTLLLASNLIPWGNLAHICLPLAQLAGMIQFPMRYLTLGAALLSFGTVLFLSTLERITSLRLVHGIMGVMLILVLISSGNMVTGATDQIEPWYVHSTSTLNTTNVVVGEYLPQGTDTLLLEEKQVLTGEGVTTGELIREGTRSQIWCENTSEAESYLDLPILAYDNYHAALEDGSPAPLSTGENNRIRVTLPAGYEGVITVEYRPPVYWRVSEAVSLVTLAGFAAVLILEKKKAALAQ